jgi:hypothetical protein
VRRLLGYSLVAVVLFVGIGAMADATQNRPDEVDPSSTTRIVFDVDTRDYKRSDAEAARGLWAVCSSTIFNRVLVGPAQIPEGTAVTLRPALGEHSTKRLVGCLEDATLDRVMGTVVSLQHTGRGHDDELVLGGR